MTNKKTIFPLQTGWELHFVMDHLLPASEPGEISPTGPFHLGRSNVPELVCLWLSVAVSCETELMFVGWRETASV